MVWIRSYEKSRFRSNFLLTGFFLLLLPLMVFGNDVYGKAIFMSWDDPSLDGSSAPGVLITLSNEQLGCYFTYSNDKGIFRLMDLPSGVYKIKAEMIGFYTMVKGFSPLDDVSIELCCGKRVKFDVVLVFHGIIDWVRRRRLPVTITGFDMSHSRQFCITKEFLDRFPIK